MAHQHWGLDHQTLGLIQDNLRKMVVYIVGQNGDIMADIVGTLMRYYSRYLGVF